MKKVMLVFGTRPEAIKMCPLVIELRKRPEVSTLVCVTGQHHHLLRQVLDFFQIQPDYRLEIMKDRQTLSDITTAVITGLQPILMKEAPDLILVHGDTSTAFSAALAAFYLKIPVGHIEAGLRTHDLESPFPEEFNRQAIDLVSRYYFAPTKYAADQLLLEGKDPASIFMTGNTGIDALRYTYQENFRHPELDWASRGKLVLVTAHRRENIGMPLHRMFRAIRRVLEEHPCCRAVLSVHANPEVSNTAAEEFADCEQIHILEAVDVMVWHNLEARCYVCLTDSGGIQEECSYWGRPVLVMRKHTERIEGIQSGSIRLIGTEEESVYQGFSEILDHQDVYDRMCRKCAAYGNGRASEFIADMICYEEKQGEEDLPTHVFPGSRLWGCARRD